MTAALIVLIVIVGAPLLAIDFYCLYGLARRVVRS